MHVMYAHHARHVMHDSFPFMNIDIISKKILLVIVYLDGLYLTPQWIGLEVQASQMVLDIIFEFVFISWNNWFMTMLSPFTESYWVTLRDDHHTLWHTSLQEYLSATMMYALFNFAQEHHVSYILLVVIATYFLRIVPNLYMCVAFCMNWQLYINGCFYIWTWYSMIMKIHDPMFL